MEEEEGRGLGWFPGGGGDGGGDGDGDGDGAAAAASTSTPIADTNVGFKMLVKMGWTVGRGLGRNEDGRCEPVAMGVDSGVRLGLGKQREDDRWTNPELITRRLLESEVQANEDDARRARREAAVARDEAIRADVGAALAKFRCDLCAKQYANAAELDVHLGSYDHHHKKRLQEAKASMAERTRDERQRREAKRAEKEAARMQQQ